MDSPFNRLNRLQELIRRRDRRKKIPVSRLRDRENPFEFFNEIQFKRRYHMYKDTVAYVINEIAANLCSPMKRGTQLPPTLQVLITLQFYCTGSMQITLADYCKINQSTASRVIKRVSTELAKLNSKYVTFPSTKQAPSVREQFYDIASFPGKNIRNNVDNHQ